MRRALSGRGSHSFKRLKIASEEFADPALVVFTLAISPGMERCVKPMTLRAQNSADLPMERWLGFRKCVQSLSQISQQIGHVRDWLRVCFMVAPYVSDDPRSLRRFWYSLAVSSRANLLHNRGKWSVPAHLFPILFTGTFQGCALPLRVQPHLTREGVVHRLFHPACQCHGSWRLPNVATRSTPPLWKEGSPGGGHRLTRQVLEIPCASTAEMHKWKTELEYETPRSVKPRVTSSDKVARTKKRACLVNRTAHAALSEIDEGLLAAQCFWNQFRDNVKDRRLSPGVRAERVRARVAHHHEDWITSWLRTHLCWPHLGAC